MIKFIYIIVILFQLYSQKKADKDPLFENSDSCNFNEKFCFSSNNNFITDYLRDIP
jgi:hypothetical protein